MKHHQSIAAPGEPTLTALAHVLNTHGYRLERSFDLRSARHATTTDQYVVLLAYEQATSAPPIVITAHECDGITHLSASTIQPGDPLTHALLAAFDEVPRHLV
jgi:hypothetical protein